MSATSPRSGSDSSRSVKKTVPFASTILHILFLFHKLGSLPVVKLELYKRELIHTKINLTESIRGLIRRYKCVLY